MRAPTATELLGAWERGLSQSQALRGLTLLGLIESTVPVEQLAGYSIGRRDALLWSLREAAFGSGVSAQAACPSCGAQLEMDFTVEDIRQESLAAPDGELSVSVNDYEIHFRLPNSADLLMLPAAGDIETLKRHLLERCVLGVRRQEQAVDGWPLPPEVGSAMSERMAEADPQGDVELAASCPECAHRWKTPLDAVSFLWTELHAWALRILREVHALAAAYGWHESEILALTPCRRQAYLELNGA
jgi:hypothetical protein